MFVVRHLIGPSSESRLDRTLFVLLKIFFLKPRLSQKSTPLLLFESKQVSHLWGRSLSEDDWYEPCRQWAGLRLLSPLLTFTLTWTEHSSPSKGAIKIACSRFHHHKPLTARGNYLLPSTICMQIIVPLSVRSVCVGWWVVSYYDQSAELCRNWLPLSFTLKISVYL